MCLFFLFSYAARVHVRVLVWICFCVVGVLEMEGSGDVIRKLYFSGEFSKKASQINNSWNWVKEIIIVFIFL